MKPRKTPPTRGLVAVAMHVLLGFFILSVGLVTGIAHSPAGGLHQMDVAPGIVIQAASANPKTSLRLNVKPSVIVKLQSPVGNLLG